MRKDLDARLELETPEQVVLSLPLAGVGSRMAAYGLDLLVRIGLSVLLVVPGVFILVNWPGQAMPALVAMIAGGFLLHFGYYVYHDVVNRGQTPGKRRMGLRTIKANGAPVDFVSSVIRNLLRILDWLPGFYGVGVTAAFLSAQEQRLGDVAAGTVVISERGTSPPPSGDVPMAADYEEVCRSMGILRPERIRPSLSTDEAEALRRLLRGLPLMDPAAADGLVQELAVRLAAKTADPEGELAPFFADPEGRVPALRFLLARHLADAARARSAAGRDG